MTDPSQPALFDEPAGRRWRARAVLLTGPSGSGKSYLARRLGLPVLPLDDFYRDGDDPDLPRRFGIVDWDDQDSWDAHRAMAALEQVCRTGCAEVPVYDIPSSRRTGTGVLDLGQSPVVVAEGIFADQLVAPARAASLLADAICIDRHRGATFTRRLARDLVEGRKPPLTLVRRGLALAREEPRLRARWVAAGCRPLSLADAEAAVRALLVASPSAHR